MSAALNAARSDELVTALEMVESSMDGRTLNALRLCVSKDPGAATGGPYLAATRARVVAAVMGVRS